MSNAGKLGFDTFRMTFYRRVHMSNGSLLCYQMIDDMGIPTKGDTVFHDTCNEANLKKDKHTKKKRRRINQFRDPESLWNSPKLDEILR